ncbi:MAG: SAM-dependent methyltransferase, partial [Planctomycetota bacterium]
FVESRLVTSFRVIETMPFDRKRLAGWLRDRGIGRLEIKVRGVDVQPEVLRKQLKPKGNAAATLLIYPNTERKTQVVIAERVRSEC